MIAPFTRLVSERNSPHYRAGKLTCSRMKGIVCCRPPCAHRQEDVAVIVRIPMLLAAALALSMALRVPAQEPARLSVDSGPVLTPCFDPTLNQKFADAIVEYLRQSRRLHDYTIDVVFQNGTAALTGTVADPLQREEAVQMVRGMPGVERVIDHVTCTAEDSVTPVQAVPPPVETAPVPNGAQGGYGPNFVVDPQPLVQAPMPGPYDLNPPKMPPYAWPTYAPYNNYSRVAYPELYPYQSWPFIGPIYPFPKVPLGWRAVKLEWQDGHWWLSRYATRHDWWRLRYW